MAAVFSTATAAAAPVCPTDPSASASRFYAEHRRLSFRAPPSRRLLPLPVSVSKVVLSFLRRLTDRAAASNPEELSQLRSLQGNLTWAFGSLFFSARQAARPSDYLNTPLTVVAAGMAKWLDIYSGVLMVRVLLSCLSPQLEISAIRISISSGTSSGTIAVLGTLGSIINSIRIMKY